MLLDEKMGRTDTGGTAPEKESRKWIAYATTAMLCFTACNEAISEITSRSGPLCILYFSLGSLLSGLFYNLYFSYRNYRKGRTLSALSTADGDRSDAGKFWLN